MLESHLAPMYVLTAGAAKGDPPRTEFYSGKESQLWKFESNMMVDRRGWALEMVGSPNPVQGLGNFIITDKKGTEAQKFNIDGHMFQSMVNTWAIDIPGASVDPNGKDIYLWPQHGGTNQLWNVLTVLLSKDGTSLCASLFLSDLFQSVISHLSLMEFMLTTVLWIPRMITGAQLPGMWQTTL